MDVSKIRTAREYLRVSQDRSGRGKSNREQHAENMAAAERNRWSLGKTYEDRSISASRYTKKAREGYDQLVADLESGAFTDDALIIWESSRGSRRVGEWVLLCDLLEERAKFVHVTTHNRTYDPRNPRDRRSLLEDAVDSEYESGKLSTRIARDAEAAAKAGKPPTKGAFGHPRRYWAENEQGQRERYTVPAEQIEREREAVRRLYDGLFAGKTLVTLAKEVDAMGLLTARGNRFDRGAVRTVLLNPRNAAIRYYKGERLDVAVKWDRIVSEETWQAAVHLLGDPKRKKNHGTARRWLGGSLYLCGKCNESDVRVNYREDGRVYRCRATGHNSRKADKVDAFVLATVATRLRRDDVAELLVARDEKERAAELRTEATGLRKRLDGLGIDYAEGNLTGGQVRAATQQLESRLAEIDAELATIGRHDQLAYLFTADDPAQKFLNASLDVQRATIDALCTVTLLPNPNKRWGLLQDTVQITWK